jgi:hypothetical protein
MPESPEDTTRWRSRIYATSGDEMFGKAIELTLQTSPEERAELFARLADEIAAITTAPDSGMKPWTCTQHTGTDGSRIFRGGVGSSVVIDPAGRLWRARSYEDFETTYTLTSTTCEIASLKPLYSLMREYVCCKDRENRRPGSTGA